MPLSPARTIALPSGERIPALGQGTWRWAERRNRRADELTSLRTGLDLGMTLVDTAEMYARGGAEELLGEGLTGVRDQVFLVSKVLPSNASRTGTVAACERSLKRLRTDRLDLYLLHWPGQHPLQETVAAFDELVQAGKIRYWGVSNLDLDWMSDLLDVPGGQHVATNQILYNLAKRGPERDLMPWSACHGIPIMAYSPIEQGRILHHPVLADLAGAHGVRPAAVALAWVLRHDSVCAIPRSGNPEHVRENAAAWELRFSEDELSALDAVFAPPDDPQPLEVR